MNVRQLAPALLLLMAPIALLSGPSRGEDAKEVKLDGIAFDAFKARLAENPTKAKYTLVDAWATFCPPCKENFPHLIEMDKKYREKGLAIVSVSFDDPANPKKIQEAHAFLKEKKATFANFYITGDSTAGFDGFDVGAIPAVFLYGPDGKELRRFTVQDPDNQFTYDEVEAAVKALLDGKPLPEDNRKAKSKG